MELNDMVPYHLQIKEVLEKEIIAGKYCERIPSELELMERFDVSRSTVRQAVNHLVDEGLLEKKHGKGTFVSFRPVMDWLGSFKTYENIVGDMGMRPYIKPVKAGEISMDENLTKVFGTDKAYLVKRIRYADDLPISIEENYYPLEIGDKIKDTNWDNIASYSVLQSAGVILWDASQVITARMPTIEEKEWLNLPDHTPVLYIERLNYDTDGQLVEYERSVYRADMYSFVVDFGRN